MQEFRDKILELDKLNRKLLAKGIEARKKAEIEFHDLNRSLSYGQEFEGYVAEEMLSNKRFYKTTKRSNKYLEDWIAKYAKNKIVLDYACGMGELTIKASRVGAKLAIGLDISPKSLDLAIQNLGSEEFENLIFMVGDAEKTGLPDNSIDIVMCTGMLHHLNLSYAFYELRRILKPGGKIIAVEALDINPFIKLYRKLTPHLRTDFESKHILSLKDLSFARYFFRVSNVRYWHVIGYLGAYIPLLSGVLDTLDRVILEKIPLVNRLAWQFTFEMTKHEVEYRIEA
jgi:SAM-dependent methyltransferase